MLTCKQRALSLKKQVYAREHRSKFALGSMAKVESVTKDIKQKYLFF